jgi:hypothetical protein
MFNSTITGYLFDESNINGVYSKYLVIHFSNHPDIKINLKDPDKWAVNTYGDRQPKGGAALAFIMSLDSVNVHYDLFEAIPIFDPDILYRKVTVEGTTESFYADGRPIEFTKWRILSLGDIDGDVQDKYRKRNTKRTGLKRPVEFEEKQVIMSLESWIN